MITEMMLPPDALANEVIVVTGGGTGLGKAMATMFSKAGAQVCICSRKESVIQKTASEIETLTRNKVIAVVCDVRKPDDVENVLHQTINAFGKVTALVNNAAGNFLMPTEKLNHKAFDVVTDIVLKGTYNFTLSFGKYWIAKQQAAKVLNIVTTYAFTGSGFVVPSAIAKAGVLTLTKSLAVEWAKYNIRMNAIAPGPFPTEGAFSRLFPDEVKTYLPDPIERIPLNRLGHPNELANLASYLISDFSSFINGECIVIDGGEWLKGAGQFNDMEKVPAQFWEMWERMRK